MGTGSQLATMVFLMILFATATTLYMGRGAIIVSFIICYSLTSVVAGYSSGALFCRSQGGTWIKTMMLTAGLFPGWCQCPRRARFRSPRFAGCPPMMERSEHAFPARPW